MAIAEAELTDHIIEWVRKNTRGTSAAEREITPETDLLATGLLDSLAFIDLIGFVESHVGCGVDLNDADPIDFTTVNGLCRLALSRKP